MKDTAMTTTTIEIKSRYGDVLFSFAADSMKSALEAAVKSGADLRDANLRCASLEGVNLEGSRLDGANLEGASLINANLINAKLRDASFEGADLRDANLRDAYLEGANLGNANLEGAYLRGVRLPTGETLTEYIEQVVPTLCTAGGKTLEEVAAAWDCHSWENCPMAVAFGVHRIDDVPIRYRPRVEQFVQLFDADQIPKPIAGHQEGG